MRDYLSELPKLLDDVLAGRIESRARPGLRNRPRRDRRGVSCDGRTSAVRSSPSYASGASDGRWTDNQLRRIGGSETLKITAGCRDGTARARGRSGSCVPAMTSTYGPSTARGAAGIASHRTGKRPGSGLGRQRREGRDGAGRRRRRARRIRCRLSREVRPVREHRRHHHRHRSPRHHPLADAPDMTTRQHRDRRLTRTPGRPRRRPCRSAEESRRAVSWPCLDSCDHGPRADRVLRQLRVRRSTPVRQSSTRAPA